jgi:hypothetical protein
MSGMGATSLGWHAHFVAPRAMPGVRDLVRHDSGQLGFSMSEAHYPELTWKKPPGKANAKRSLEL